MKFSIRTLFAATILIGLMVSSCVWVADWHDRNDGYGPYHSEDRWPRALKELLADEPELKSEVTPFALIESLDHLSIWLLTANSKLRQKIDLNHELERTTRNHPLSAELIESIPDSWQVDKQNLDSWIWHGTPGYGSRHIEGLDWFLIIDDPKSGKSIVIHEWIF